MYSLEIVRGTDLLNAFFSPRHEPYPAGADPEYLRLHHRDFRRRHPRGTPREIEAARAYGFTPFKLYRAIILPSVLRTALLAYSNEVILMLHSTALAFTAMVPDIVKIARDINSATYQPFYAFSIAAVMYLMISFVLIKLFKQADKRWLRHVKPQ